MRWYDWVAFLLVTGGAINWGLFGIFSLDLVQELAQALDMRFIDTITYALIGVAGIASLVRVIYLQINK